MGTGEGLVRKFGLALVPSHDVIERWENLVRDLVVDGMGLNDAAETAARVTFVGYRMNTFEKNVSLDPLLPLDVVQMIPGAPQRPRDTPEMPDGLWA